MKKLLMLSLLFIGCSKSNDKPASYKIILTNTIDSRAYVDSVLFKGVKITSGQIAPGGSFSAAIDGGGTIDVYITGGTTGSFVDITNSNGTPYSSNSFYTSGIHATASVSVGDVLVKVYKK